MATMTSATAQPQIQNPSRQITSQLRRQGMTMCNSCAVSVIVIRESAGRVFTIRYYSEAVGIITWMVGECHRNSEGGNSPLFKFRNAVASIVTVTFHDHSACSTNISDT